MKLNIFRQPNLQCEASAPHTIECVTLSLSEDEELIIRFAASWFTRGTGLTVSAPMLQRQIDAAGNCTERRVVCIKADSSDELRNKQELAKFVDRAMTLVGLTEMFIFEIEVEPEPMPRYTV